MPRLSYVNGRYLRHPLAKVHVEDRGYQFADGVYEVIATVDGVPIDAEAHFERLGRSLAELRIPWPLPRIALEVIMRNVIHRNRIGQGPGMVYIQISRGVAPRDHGFPATNIRPSLVVGARRARAPDPKIAENGVAVITLPDLRWGRCDIKSISLLPNVLGKQAAREAGAFEAWLVDSEGKVTEGTSTNAWIVDGVGRLQTRHADHAILRGVTRLAVGDLAVRAGMTVIERPFTVAEAQMAPEAFLTSTTGGVVPVVRIDGKTLGDGRPGRVAARLRQLYFQEMDAAARQRARRPERQG